MDKREQQIRKRASFQMWLNASKFLDGKPSKREIIVFMHGLLNGKDAYGSITNANYSRESLELVLRDEPAQPAVKVGGSYSGDELMVALGGNLHDGLYAIGNDRTVVVGQDEGNDNYQVIAVFAR